MKNQTKLIAFALLSLLITQPSMANNRCMPNVLSFVIQDFDHSLQTTGIIVRDQGGSQPINLGKNISQISVKISDIHKNSYRIDIPLTFIDFKSTKIVVRTTVMIEDYESCKMTTEKPVYDFYNRLN